MRAAPRVGTDAHPHSRWSRSCSLKTWARAGPGDDRRSMIKGTGTLRIERVRTVTSSGFQNGRTDRRSEGIRESKESILRLPRSTASPGSLRLRRLPPRLDRWHNQYEPNIRATRIEPQLEYHPASHR